MKNGAKLVVSFPRSGNFFFLGEEDKQNNCFNLYTKIATVGI
jgi:hypothetical protein